MKKILVIFLIPVLILQAQFKEEADKLPSVQGSISNGQPTELFLGFLNMENFSMNHSVGMSYSSWGGNGVMLGTYTNSMFYKISEDLNIEVDASLVTSPYSTFGESYSKEISGIYLSRAQLNYRLSEKSSISIQYFNPAGGNYPYNYLGYSGYRYGYFSPFHETLPTGIDRN